MDFAEQFFILRISELGNINPNLVGSSTWERTMKSLFGVSLVVLLQVWTHLANMESENNLHPEHLLMGLYFLEVYPSEAVACGVFWVTPKTWRKWTKIVIEEIASLKLVIAFQLLRIID